MHPMPERAGVRVEVDGDHAVAAVTGEGVAREEAGGRLANTALARDECDRAAANDWRSHLRDELAPAQLGGARRDRNLLAGEEVDGPPPPAPGRATCTAEHPLRGE